MILNKEPVGVNEIYQRVQGLFVDKLVCVLGSGASCAFGLPSMGDLANHLSASVDPKSSSFSTREQRTWASILGRLGSNASLEETLSRYKLTPRVLEVVRAEIASCIRLAETAAIQAILDGKTLNSYGELFERVLRVNPVADVITTNYDRLIEVSAAIAGHSLDTLFHGQTLGHLDPAESHLEFVRLTNPTGSNKSRSTLKHHIRLSKPHGSLDWFERHGELYKSDLPIRAVPKIIAPTTGKFKESWDLAFKAHSDRMAAAVRGAEAMLFHGFGFNDEHLQSELAKRFQKVPTLVIAKSLTSNARALLATSEKAIGIEESSEGTGSVIHFEKNQHLYISADIWRLPILLSEVLDEKGK